MENIKRYGLSNYKEVNDGVKLPLYCSSIYGVYEIPDEDKIGFYKINGAMLDAREDADLRELLAADILNEIDIPHANIIPVYDEKNSKNGCISVNILRDNEEFISVDENRTPALTVEAFIDREIDDMSKLSNVTKEMLDSRRKYAIQYLFLSAFLSNADLKQDNIKLIYNTITNEYRNAEYYDSGVAFVEGRPFFGNLHAKDLLVKLYKDYPMEILPIAEKIESKLSRSKIDDIMANNIYNGFEENTKESIKENLNDRIEFINRNNDIIRKKIGVKKEISLDEIEKLTDGVDVFLKKIIGNVLLNLKNKVLGDKTNDASR